MPRGDSKRLPYGYTTCKDSYRFPGTIQQIFHARGLLGEVRILSTANLSHSSCFSLPERWFIGNVEDVESNINRNYSCRLGLQILRVTHSISQISNF